VLDLLLCYPFCGSRQFWPMPISKSEVPNLFPEKHPQPFHLPRANAVTFVHSVSGLVFTWKTYVINDNVDPTTHKNDVLSHNCSQITIFVIFEGSRKASMVFSNQHRGSAEFQPVICLTYSTHSRLALDTLQNRLIFAQPMTLMQG